MDLEVLIIASFLVFIVLFIHLGRKGIRLEEELKARINEELAQYGLQAGVSPIRPWYIGRNDTTRMGFLIRVKNNKTAEKTIFDYDSICYAALDLDGHLDISGKMPATGGEEANGTPSVASPGPEARSPARKAGKPDPTASLGAQEYRKNRKKIELAEFTVYFTDGRHTSISLRSPYNSILGNLINIYNFFAEQAAANTGPTPQSTQTATSDTNS